MDLLRFARHRIAGGCPRHSIDHLGLSLDTLVY